MKDFFVKIGHLFQHIDHWVMGAIHYIGNYFEGAVITHAIEVVKQGAEQYIDSEFKNAQTRTFAVDSLIAKFPGMTVNSAHVLVSHILSILDSESASLLDHLAAHLETAAPPTTGPNVTQ